MAELNHSPYHLTNLPYKYIILSMNITIYKCMRCYHEWASKQNKPTICPKCKSPYWGKPRRARKHYVKVTMPTHHRADNSGRVHRSVLVMEDYLGRELSPSEEVHHINGDVIDDRIENLELTTHAEHAKRHGFHDYNLNPKNGKGRLFRGNKYVLADRTKR